MNKKVTSIVDKSVFDLLNKKVPGLVDKSFLTKIIEKDGIQMKRNSVAPRLDSACS